MLHVTEIDGPAFLEPMLIHGDASTLTRAEDMNILAEFEALLPKDGLVVQASPETWYGTWNGHRYDLCTYTVHYHTEA